jgi:cytochrome c oxidase cbb3-type subunit 3
MNKKFFTLLLIAALPLFGAMAYMKMPDEVIIDLLANGTNWLIFILVVLIFISALRMFSYLNQLQDMILGQQAEEAGLTEEQAPTRVSWWTNFYAQMTDAVPVEYEEQIMTDHEYDGIIELDNNLPPWWKAGFYLGIVFAVIYLMRYHVLQLEPLSAESYAIEMQEAEESIKEYLATAKDLVDENNVQYLTDATSLSNGAKLFAQNCAVCHAADGGGGVGPNLTDPYWKHGGSIVDVFSTIKYGVPTMGMIAWKDNLRPGELQEVASFVLSMQGETPLKPKEAEGELYVPASDELAVVE